MTKLIAEVLHIRRGKPMVSSLRIAELFGRRHTNVLRAIRKEMAEEISRLKIESSDYVDERGKTQPMYLLDERQALYIMPFIGGRKAREGQRLLVDAYLYYRDQYANPPRDVLLDLKRALHLPMTDALKEAREEAGKETLAHHYINENKLCNGVLIGEFTALDESALSNEQADLLAKLRKRNAAFLVAGLSYQERKAKLIAYCSRLKTIKLLP